MSDNKKTIIKAISFEESNKEVKRLGESATALCGGLDVARELSGVGSKPESFRLSRELD